MTPWTLSNHIPVLERSNRLYSSAPNSSARGAGASGTQGPAGEDPTNSDARFKEATKPEQLISELNTLAADAHPLREELLVATFSRHFGGKDKIPPVTYLMKAVQQALAVQLFTAHHPEAVSHLSISPFSCFDDLNLLFLTDLCHF